jgi:3-oxoacyl-[acyl-carrier protein] reductase
MINLAKMPESRPAAVVTGSTSGIGLAIAERLLRHGYGVTLNYSFDKERAASVLSECKNINSDVVLVQANVAKEEEARKLIERTVAQFGRLDVLINNAAVVADRPIIEMKSVEWDRVLDVNLRGAFLCSRLAALQMMDQETGGVILNIGASTGIRARRNGANTCASKAGLMILTQCLALELAPKVRANTIVPGLVVTDETTERFDLDSPSVRSAREDAVPMRRLGRPDDVADAVMLLLSDESRFITGQKIVVDGGQNMW